jgi:hypothetical protein
VAISPRHGMIAIGRFPGNRVATQNERQSHANHMFFSTPIDLGSIAIFRHDI